MVPNSPSSLEEQLSELRTRVSRLEEALRIQGTALETRPVPPGSTTGATTPTAPKTAAYPSSIPAGPVPPGTAQAPREREQGTTQTAGFPMGVPARGASTLFAPAQQGQGEPGRSLESRIGSQWFNRVGILAMLIGVAWFLKLAFDNHWIGPLGRIIIGLLAGVALIVWSERFQRRGYPVFSYSLKAVGSGTLYLSLWAAFSLYALLPPGAAFAAMIAVTAFNGYMSWLENSELLALYAILGGLSTPLLVSTGGNHEITLFVYLLILDLTVLVLAAARPWSRLLFMAYVGTVLFAAGWWVEFYSQAQAGRTAFFVACFFLIFAFAPRLVRAGDTGQEHHPAWDSFALIILPIINAALGFLAFYGLLSPSALNWAGSWLAVAFAAFYLLLLRMPARGALRPSSEPLSALYLAAAVVFLTIAIPLKSHGRWLTIGWLAEGAVLLWLAIRMRQQLLQVLALVCLVLGLFALLIVNPPAAATPFLNQRFATYATAIAIFALVAWMVSKTGSQPHWQLPVRSQPLAATAILVINGLILLAMSWEIHSYWWARHWRGDFSQFYNHRIYAQFTYSAFFMIFGAVLLSVGFWRRSAFLRWQALVLLALTIGKVFLVDVSALSQGLRILSFLGLGVLLLAVSFIYQRGWLHLRGGGEQIQ